MLLICTLILSFQPLLPDSRPITSCDCSHMPLHCLRNKRKREIKLKKVDKKKRKSK